MKKIIVAGAGHGGIAAAYNLAKVGYDVTVYEKCEKREDLGHPWQDFFHIDALRDAGFPMAEKGKVSRVPIAFFGPDEGVAPIKQTVKEGEYEMHMYRKDLYDHILTCAEEAGVKFVYGCTVKEPIMLGNRIAGIKTSSGDVYADLVIDACGVDSPLRRKLPEYLGVQNQFLKTESMYVYRAYYKRLEGFEDIPNEYYVYFLNDGKDGLGWIITNEDSVDVLVASFKPCTEADALEELKKYDKFAPHRSDELLLGGGIHKIPVRQPLGIMVADGYAAVGDSAGMTVPIVGSGIANSLKAGKMLADTVIDDRNNKYSAETLFKYQAKYYKQIGSSLALVDLIKILLQDLTVEDFSFFFSSGFITSEDMSFNSNEASLSAIFANITPADIIERFKKAGENKPLLKKVLKLVKNIAKLEAIMLMFPGTYNRKALDRWVANYNNFFKSLVK